MSDIPKKTIVLQENIKKNRIKIKVTSRCFYDFAVEMDTPKSIIFEDLIRGFYDGMYIKPNFYDISFYFVEVKTKDQKLDQPIESFGLTDKSYIIFLDEKKYIENSEGIKLIPYEVNHQPDHFQQTPIYLDKKPNTSFLNYSKLCNNKVKPYDYSDNTINYLPIVIVNKDEYKGVLNFLKTYFKYKDYTKITALIEKLFIKEPDNYEINHQPNTSQASFFAEVTDTNNYSKYNNNEIKNIVNQIKRQASSDNLFFQNNNFKKDIEQWVRDIMNILAEYIQFFKHVKPIYHTCYHCSYPTLFINKKEIIKKQQTIVKKLNKKINDNVNIMNCFVKLIVPSFFKEGEHPEINILYHDEGDKKTVENDSDLIKKNISGCFILTRRMEEIEKVLKEIKAEYEKDNLLKFQLIVAGESAQNVFNYILNNDYLCIFDNICILARNGNNGAYSNLKSNLSKKKRNLKLYNNFKSIKDSFINVECKKSKTRCYNYTKVINYKDYLDDYYLFHEKISKYYGDIDVTSFNYSLGIVEDFLKTVDEKKLKISTINEGGKKKSLIKALEIFGTVAEQNVDNYKDVLTKYTEEKDSFYQDLNSWLRGLDALAYDKIGYFVSDLMFCLNEYGVYKNTGVIVDTTLYRGTKLNYIDLLLYERNLGKIITLPSFTSTSVEKRVAENFSGRESLESNNGLFSVIFFIEIKDSENYCPVAFDIQEISKYESEREILILPFTFFRIKKVDISLESLKADIYLEVIRKPEVLEVYIKEKNKLTYNENENIVEVIIPVDEEEEKRKKEEEEKRKKEEEERLKREEEERKKREEGTRMKKEEEERKKKELELEIEYKINKYKKQVNLFGDKFVENNKKKIKMIINNKEQDLISIYTHNGSEDTLKIKIAPKEKITDLSYMFYKVDSLITPPNLSKWDLSSVTNMSNMFYECEMLETLPDFSNWITKNVKDMSYMFYRCYKITSIPDCSSWDTSSVENMSHMFHDCKMLTSLPDISKWDVSNLKDMNNMFNRCLKLSDFPDIKDWDVINVEDMSSMFKDCSSLKKLPDLSNWNTSSLKKITGIFHDCKSLEELPDLSNWNISKVENLSYVFYGCKSLKELPDISSWNTSEIFNMSYLFYGCKELESLPDISNWKTSNVTNMSYMFEGCSSLTSLPKITKWDTSNVSDMSGMFDGCSKLSKIPSKFKEG